MTAAVAELPRIRKQVPTWHERAACRLFPELDRREDKASGQSAFNAWFDAKPGSPEALVARTICAICPIRRSCAEDALKRGEPWGIWGGLDRRDRAEVAAEYGFPRPAVLPDHGTNSRYAKFDCRCVTCKNAHALYESQRRERARRRRLAAVEAVEPERPRVHLNLAGYHRRYRRRVGR